MQYLNPLRKVWSYVLGYMRGDDIKAAHARSVEKATAARAAASSAAPPATGAVVPAAGTTDRRRM